MEAARGGAGTRVAWSVGVMAMSSLAGCRREASERVVAEQAPADSVVPVGSAGALARVAPVASAQVQSERCLLGRPEPTAAITLDAVPPPGDGGIWGHPVRLVPLASGDRNELAMALLLSGPPAVRASLDPTRDRLIVEKEHECDVFLGQLHRWRGQWLPVRGAYATVGLSRAGLLHRINTEGLWSSDSFADTGRPPIGEAAAIAVASRTNKDRPLQAQLVMERRRNAPVYLVPPDPRLSPGSAAIHPEDSSSQGPSCEPRQVVDAITGQVLDREAVCITGRPLLRDGVALRAPLVKRGDWSLR